MDCIICLEQIRSPLGIPECCKHTFCFKCLIQWTEIQNTCPIDRMQFRVILVKDTVDSPVTRKFPVQSKESSIFAHHPLTTYEWLNVILEVQRKFFEIFSSISTNVDNLNYVLSWLTRAKCRQYLRTCIQFRDFYGQLSHITGFYQFLNPIQKRIFTEIFGLLFENYNILFDIFKSVNDPRLEMPCCIEEFVDEFDLIFLLVNMFVLNLLNYISQIRRSVTSQAARTNE